MKPLRVSVEAAAPAARVWSVMTDLERSAEVISAIDRVERLDAGNDFGIGTRWRETRTIFGKEASEELEVTAIEPGRSYVVEADSRGTRYRSEVGVEPVGEGRSRLWTSFAGQPHSLVGRLMAAAVGRLFAGATRKMLAKDLQDIARAAEQKG